MDLRSHRGSLTIEVLAEALVYGNALEEDLKYLGSWVNSLEKAIKLRKSIAWRGLNGMTRVWKSNLPRDTKHHFFYGICTPTLM